MAEKLVYPMTEESLSSRPKQVSFHLPATMMETPHREALVYISSMPDGSFIGVGQDGLISIWTSDLELKKSKIILDENKLPNRKIKWIVASILMSSYNKLIVGTCDREIRFYELSNYEPYCQIIGLESMPLRLDYSDRGKDECIILYGDEQGCVNIFLVSSMGDTLRTWTKCPAVDEIPSVFLDSVMDSGLVTFTRWKVHNDWVTQIKYVHSIKSVISSSNDDCTALVIGCVEGTKNVQKRLKDLMDSSTEKRKRSVLVGGVIPKRLPDDESLFKVYKGVKTFDFCKECNILVTGGLDRVIRLWNPYITGWPTGMLSGHPSPIAFLQITDRNTKLFSMSLDCTVMVWDIEDQTCLLSVIPKASGISGELAAAYFSPELGALCIAADSLALLQLQDRQAQLSSSLVSHGEPVLGCLYNQRFRQVVSCSEGSVIKAWDLQTGQLLAELDDAHGDAAVTCLAFDNSGKRLVTGGRDGSVKRWNYSPLIHYIQTLKPAARSEDEINDCTFAEIYNNRYVISVGWDRRISVFPDQHDEPASETQCPQSDRINNEGNGQKDDILCVASCPPNLLATSSYDGDVLLWNLVSGHILSRLNPSTRMQLEDGTDDLIINKVIFLHSRIKRKKEAASLVASGPRGYVAFWNTFREGTLFACFPGSLYRSVICDIATNADDSLLGAADLLGHVYIWHISEYAHHGPEAQAPALLRTWRAHSCNITSISLVSEQGLCLTSSLDCTVRLWSLKGEHVGTFGQRQLWDLKEKSSWKNTCNLNTIEAPESQVSGTQPSSTEVETERTEGGPMVTDALGSVEDAEIAEELRERCKTKAKPRTLHYRHKQVELQQLCGRLNAYQSLQLCELAIVTPSIHKPNPAAELNDPYDLTF
ncbi:WD repeat-containing protein 64-like [Rhinatrema bivittatum]|uniref:WD repeat-containing protein 64-like n=1 Tax=Rhinatrema bivittatum TaxID=194408 RepID=UPI00112D18A6|nr:WD repeat-containing protein 64-like [Rhinatrema bivittatum]